MRFRRALTGLLVLALLAVVPAAAGADDTLIDRLEKILETYGIDVDDDAMVRVGEDIRITPGRHMEQDVVAVGANIRVGAGAHIEGNIVAIGGNVRLGAGAHGEYDVAAISGDVHLSAGARVEDDVIAVGGRVRQSFGARVEGRVWEPPLDGAARDELLAVIAQATAQSGQSATGEAPSDFRVERGDIGGFGHTLRVPPGVRHDGDVAIVGGTLDVAGLLEGDVVMVGGRLRLYEDGAIDGEMVTFGTVVERDLPLAAFGASGPNGTAFIIFDPETTRSYGHGFALANLIVLAAFGVVVLLFNLLLEPLLERAEVELEQGPGRALLVGLILEVALPPLLTLLCITVVLIPVALLIILAVALGSTVAMGLVSRQMGRRLLGGDGAGSTLFHTLIGYLVLVGLAALGQLLLLVNGVAALGWALTILGYFVLLGAMTLGLGAVTLAQFGRWSRASNAPSGPPAGLEA